MRWSPEVEEALAVLREKLGEDGLLAAAKLIQASDRELQESQRRLEEKMDGLGRRMDEFQRDVTARLDGLQRRLVWTPSAGTGGRSASTWRARWPWWRWWPI